MVFLIKGFPYSEIPIAALVGSFLRLVSGMGSLAAVQALAASAAEVIFGEEFSLAGGTLFPELSRVLAVHGGYRNCSSTNMNIPTSAESCFGGRNIVGRSEEWSAVSLASFS